MTTTTNTTDYDLIEDVPAHYRIIAYIPQDKVTLIEDALKIAHARTVLITPPEAVPRHGLIVYPDKLMLNGIPLEGAGHQIIGNTFIGQYVEYSIRRAVAIQWRAVKWRWQLRLRKLVRFIARRGASA